MSYQGVVSVDLKTDRGRFTADRFRVSVGYQHAGNRTHDVCAADARFLPDYTWESASGALTVGPLNYTYMFGHSVAVLRIECLNVLDRIGVDDCELEFHNSEICTIDHQTVPSNTTAFSTTSTGTTSTGTTSTGTTRTGAVTSTTWGATSGNWSWSGNGTGSSSTTNGTTTTTTTITASSTPTTTTASATTATTAATTGGDGTGSPFMSSSTIIAFSAVGGMLGVGILAFLFYCVCCRKRREYELVANS